MIHLLSHANVLFKSSLISNLLFLAVALRFVEVRSEDLFIAPVIDGTGSDWKELGENDFAGGNGDPDTWKWDGALVHGTGKPIGVLPSVKKYKNIELVASWRHLEVAGNSGIFLWCTEEALKEMKRDKLPKAGIEIQALDLGYVEKYESSSGKKADFFTTHGDVFAVGSSTMVPFPPTSPNGSRSFPKENRSRGTPEWNHYYVRAINGEVRLWVNGREVSGGKDCNPAEGFLCLESEGSPIEFKNIRIRELP